MLSQENEDEQAKADQLGLDSSSQAANLSNSSQASFLSPRSVKYVQSVEEAYYKYMDGTKFRRKCLGCDKVLKTREIKRLQEHVSECKWLVLDGDTREIMEGPVKRKYCHSDRDYTTLLTEMIAENGLPYHLVESRTWRKFINAAIPNWRYPSRKALSDIYVPRLAKEKKERFFCDSGGKPAHYQLTVEFDHWSPPSRQSFFGVVITKPAGESILHDLIDVSAFSHTGEQILNCALKSLESIPTMSINEVISDSASNCKKARELLIKTHKFKHVIHHRCWAHHLNNLGNHLVENNFSDEVEWAAKATSIVRRNQRLMAMIKLAKKPRLESACNVRWYSTLAMIERLFDARDVILDNCDLLREEGFELINEVDHWDAVEQVQSVLRPIVESISLAERKDASLGETAKVIFELGHSIFALNWNVEINISTITSYLCYVQLKKLGKYEFGILLAAYLLDVRFCQDYVTKEARKLAFNAIMRVANKSGLSSETIRGPLMRELVVYSKREGEYSGITAEDADRPLDWWNNFSGGGYLKEIALRFARLKSSSANIERTFSTIRIVQGLSRTNFSLDSLISLAQLRQDSSKTFDAVLDLKQFSNSSKPVNAKPELLNEEARVMFEEFSCLIDYSIVHQKGLGSKLSEETLQDSFLEDLASEAVSLIEPYGPTDGFCNTQTNFDNQEFASSVSESLSEN